MPKRRQGEAQRVVKDDLPLGKYAWYMMLVIQRDLVRKAMKTTPSKVLHNHEEYLTSLINPLTQEIVAHGSNQGIHPSGGLPPAVR